LALKRPCSERNTIVVGLWRTLVFSQPPPKRLSASAAILALLAAAGAIGLAAQAMAHHPGSHARRQSDGQVLLEVVALMADACTTIRGIEVAAPPSLKPPGGAEPVTVHIARPAGASCAAVVRAARESVFLTVPADRRVLHVFVLTPNGDVQRTERVPIQ